MVRKLKILVAQRVSELLGKQPKLDHYVPILCYHRVLPEFIEDVNDPIYTVLPEQFESQMAFLAQGEFHTLSLSEFAATTRGLRPLAKRSVLVTFDDGYADNYAVAWPIAKKFKVTLNLFICTAYQGQPHPVIMTRNGYRSPNLEDEQPELASHIKKFPELWRPLTWQELAIMRDEGVEIALHSHTHPDFALLAPQELAQEIATGIKIFTKELGYRPKFFALPYGGYYTSRPAVLEILRGFGLEFIFSTHIGRPRLPCPRPVFPRLQVLQQDDLAVFQRKLDGGYDWLGPIHCLIQLAGLDRSHRY
jgi:peptidoglycan/xylan/chitin deacetylase (PgdA/CDA1 family)